MKDKMSNLTGIFITLEGITRVLDQEYGIDWKHNFIIAVGRKIGYITELFIYYTNKKDKKFLDEKLSYPNVFLRKTGPIKPL